MIPLRPFMNQLGGGYYPTGQSHGVYQNPSSLVISKNQYLPRAMVVDATTMAPFSGHIKFSILVKINE